MPCDYGLFQKLCQLTKETLLLVEHQPQKYNSNCLIKVSIEFKNLKSEIIEKPQEKGKGELSPR